MTTATITTEQRLAVVKHLAGGKDVDVTSLLSGLPREQVSEIARSHGYPSTEALGRALAILERKVSEGDAIPDHPNPSAVRPTRPAAVASTPTSAGVTPLTRPDEIRVLINTAKGHPSKRIQSAGDRVIDAVDRLKALLREDEEKHAEKRRQQAAKEAAKAEVERLEKALREAKAKLRGGKATSATIAISGDVTAAEIRRWASKHGIECPAVGRVPQSVREAYGDAHEKAS